MPSTAAARPVDIARAALRKMAELGLPPTHENFAAQYRRAAGLPPVDGVRPGGGLRGIEMESMLRGIVEMIGQTTTDLSGGLDRFGGEVEGLLEQVDQTDGAEGLRTLMQALTLAAVSLQDAVDHSRKSLAETEAQLSEVSAALERTQAQARTDPLTGFLNRRGMDEVVAREVARARRIPAPLAVAMIDIDHFKSVNDEHGHDVGDRALVHLAALARSVMRETDVLCRYGGEEFVAVLPGADGQGAHFVIDRMRVMLEKTPLAEGALKVQLRFSAGVAQLGNADTCESLIKRADQALYEAKRGGRNRVVVAPPGTA